MYIRQLCAVSLEGAYIKKKIASVPWDFCTENWTGFTTIQVTIDKVVLWFYSKWKNPKENKEFTAHLPWQADVQLGNPRSVRCYGDLERQIRILFQCSNHPYKPHWAGKPSSATQIFVQIMTGSHAICTVLLQQSKRENSTFERREPISPWIFDGLCKHSEHSIAINKLLFKFCI